MCCVVCFVSQLGGDSCEGVLGFVGGRATIIRSARELKVNECEMMGLWSIQSSNTVLRMALNTLIFRSTADAPTLYGLLRHSSRHAREQY